MGGNYSCVWKVLKLGYDMIHKNCKQHLLYFIYIRSESFLLFYKMLYHNATVYNKCYIYIYLYIYNETDKTPRAATKIKIYTINFCPDCLNSTYIHIHMYARTHAQTYTHIYIHRCITKASTDLTTLTRFVNCRNSVSMCW